jgi:putative DNA primase/helicase
MTQINFDPRAVDRTSNRDDLVNAARAVTLAEAAHILGMKLPRVGELTGPCPACGGRDRFSVNVRKGVWNCRGFGGGNDAIGLVQHVRSCGFLEAAEFLTGERTEASAPYPRPAPQPAGDDEAQRIALARSLWRETRDARGTIADTYLTKARGLPPLDAANARTVRLHPAFPIRNPAGELVRVPATLCAMRDPRAVFDFMAGARGELAEVEDQALADENFIRAVHATALLDDGSGKRFGKGSRKFRGVAKGAAIMIGDLWTPIYGGTLCVGEGLETMLSVLAMGAPCAFALGSAGAVGDFEYLPCVSHLRVIAEHDEASEKSVRECFTRWRDHIEDVDVLAPRVGKDANDLLLERRCAA